MHFSMKISSSQKFRAILYAAEKCTAYLHTDILHRGYNGVWNNDKTKLGYSAEGLIFVVLKPSASAECENAASVIHCCTDIAAIPSGGGVAIMNSPGVRKSNFNSPWVAKPQVVGIEIDMSDKWRIHHPYPSSWRDFHCLMVSGNFNYEGLGNNSF